VYGYFIAGYRIGKGEGYADLEFAMMMKMGAVDQNTVIAATVHDCQVHIYVIFHLFLDFKGW
jgi:5-formyltetrahydrofolate cyclo-ligase